MLSGSPAVRQVFHWWQGISGQWYVHTVYPFEGLPDIGSCNYILVRRRFDYRAEALYIGQKGDTDRFSRHEKFEPARRLGASEVHIHLLADSRQQRFEVETDLRNGHPTPLNEQPSAATSLGFGSLGFALAGLDAIERTIPATAGPASGRIGAPSLNALAELRIGKGLEDFLGTSFDPLYWLLNKR